MNKAPALRSVRGFFVDCWLVQGEATSIRIQSLTCMAL